MKVGDLISVYLISDFSGRLARDHLATGMIIRIECLETGDLIHFWGPSRNRMLYVGVLDDNKDFVIHQSVE
jgi:hypothetical protein